MRTQKYHIHLGQAVSNWFKFSRDSRIHKGFACTKTSTWWLWWCPGDVFATWSRAALSICPSRTFSGKIRILHYHLHLLQDTRRLTSPWAVVTVPSRPAIHEEYLLLHYSPISGHPWRVPFSLLSHLVSGPSMPYEPVFKWRIWWWLPFTQFAHSRSQSCWNCTVSSHSHTCNLMEFLFSTSKLDDRCSKMPYA